MTTMSMFTREESRPSYLGQLFGCTLAALVEGIPVLSFVIAYLLAEQIERWSYPAWFAGVAGLISSCGVFTWAFFLPGLSIWLACVLMAIANLLYFIFSYRNFRKKRRMWQGW